MISDVAPSGGSTASAVESAVMGPGDFSLVLGGPRYQLLRRTHLTGDALQLLRRRIVALTLLAWPPLLVLSVAEGHAWGDSISVPFLYDGAPPDEPLIGNADIQSLADLGNSFEVVRGMRWAPFTLQTVLQLAVTTLVPVVPLALTMISMEELLMRLLKIVF
jgi:hypothetical protein